MIVAKIREIGLFAQKYNMQLQKLELTASDYKKMLEEADVILTAEEMKKSIFLYGIELTRKGCICGAHPEESA